MVEELKSKYGKRLRELVIKDSEGDELKFYLVKPNRTVMEAITQKGVEQKIVEMNKVLISNCVVGGDMQAIEDDGSIYIAVISAITELIDEVSSEIKKL